MLSRAASRIVYVQPSGIASFSLSSLSRSSRFAPSSLSSQLRVSSRRGVTTTAATPPPPRPPVSTPATASTTAAAAAESASNAGGSSGSGAGKQSFFKSDSWTKTVGTVGALANWSIPIAAITHMLSTKDPATTIDPVMTTSLAVYSLLFMRWAIAISPPNYPLLVCHIANEAAQLTQLGRYAMAEKKPGVPKQPQNVPLD